MPTLAHLWQLASLALNATIGAVVIASGLYGIGWLAYQLDYLDWLHQPDQPDQPDRPGWFGWFHPDRNNHEKDIHPIPRTVKEHTP